MKISVVMTSYNYAKYIGEAIESVINQTYQDWELIIVDDASADDSLSVINKYVEQDSRIKLFINSKNLGLAGALKKALKYANGEFIAFLESDDKLKPEALEKKIKIAEEHNVDLVFSDCEVSAPSERLESHFRKGKSDYLDKYRDSIIDCFDEIIPHVNIIPTFSVVLLKKELLDKCDFNPVCKALLDYYLWVQLSQARVYYCSEKLTFWRVHSDSYMNKVHYSELQKLLFRAFFVFYTVQGNIFLRIFKSLNYIRRYFITVKIVDKKIKFVFCHDGEKLGYSI